MSMHAFQVLLVIGSPYQGWQPLSLHGPRVSFGTCENEMPSAGLRSRVPSRDVWYHVNIWGPPIIPCQQI